MLPLRQIFTVFLRIGFIAFGGPAAHAAIMERELVSRRKWIDAQAFLDYLGAVNLIPGPNSTQLTFLAGYQLRGVRGMLAAGFGFILPSVLITGLLAWLYVSMGQLPAISALFFGIKPAVIAVIAAAILQLGKKAMKNVWLGALGLITLLASLLFLNEIIAILGAGLLGILAFIAKNHCRKKRPNNNPPSIPKPKPSPLNPKPSSSRKSLTSIRDFASRNLNLNLNLKPNPNPNLPSLAPVWFLSTLTAGLASFSLLKLFWVFFKIGAVLFGSGYVLVAYMDGELVEKLDWLSRSQLLDAIAIGQFTPGPILSAATFAGFLIDGTPGALVATLGIFLPSFVYIMILYPIIPKLRKSLYAAAFLDAVNIAAVAVMLSVSIVMVIQILNIHTDAVLVNTFSEIDWRALLIMTLATITVFRFKKLGSVWIILGGALLGLVLSI